jgi:hypothetical protein
MMLVQGRDALLIASANGISTEDIIQFNLTDQSPSGKTITLASALPGTSSNLVIDASSQPGVFFGKSQAKIMLFIRDRLLSFTFFRLLKRAFSIRI